MDDSDVCHCGHTFAEHETGFFKPCAADDCDCDDFEHDEEADEPWAPQR